MLEERIEIIKIYSKNGENLAETLSTLLGRREAPCRTAIKKLVEKLELLGQVSDVAQELFTSSRIRKDCAIERLLMILWPKLDTYYRSGQRSLSTRRRYVPHKQRNH